MLALMMSDKQDRKSTLINSTFTIVSTSMAVDGLSIINHFTATTYQMVIYVCSFLKIFSEFIHYKIHSIFSKKLLLYGPHDLFFNFECSTYCHQTFISDKSESTKSLYLVSN